MMFQMKNKMKELFQGGFFHIFLSNTLIKILGFVSSVVIIRLVNKSDYAAYMYSLNLFSYISLLSGLGLSVALLKVCSSEKETAKNLAYIRVALLLGGSFQLCASLTICFIASMIEIPFPTAKPLVYLSVMLPVCSYIVEIFQCYFRSQLKNRLFAKVSVFQVASILCISIVLVTMVGIKGAIIAQYCTYAIVIAFCFWYINNSTSSSFDYRLNGSQIKSFLMIGLSLMLANFFSMMMPSNEMLLINNLIKSETITANYKVAVLIPTQLQFITGSVMVYYFPLIAKMKNGVEIFHRIRRIGVFVMGIIFFIVVLGMLLTPIIIKYVYGEKYLDAISLAYIFWVAYGINAAFRMVPINIFPAIGAYRFGSLLAMISCGAHFIIDYYLIKHYGIWGAAYALIIVYFLSGVAAWIYVYYCCKRNICE